MHTKKSHTVYKVCVEICNFRGESKDLGGVGVEISEVKSLENYYYGQSRHGRVWSAIMRDKICLVGRGRDIYCLENDDKMCELVSVDAMEKGERVERFADGWMLSKRSSRKMT